MAEFSQDKLVLISNSTNFGSGYLDHCAEAIDEFLGAIREVVFVPFALRGITGRMPTK